MTSAMSFKATRAICICLTCKSNMMLLTVIVGSAVNMGLLEHPSVQTEFGDLKLQIF